MWICRECGEPFDVRIVDEIDTETGAIYYSCPECGSGNIEEARVCPMCGAYIYSELTVCLDCESYLDIKLSMLGKELGFNSMEEFQDAICQNYDWR